MSQKTGKRTRKHIEGSPQSIEKNEETAKKLEPVNAEEKTTEKNTEKCENGTETVIQEGETQTKEDIAKLTQSDVLDGSSQSNEVQLQCEIVVEAENFDQNKSGKSEQGESENELEPLVLEEQSNGVQILIENTEKVTESTDEVSESTEEVKEIVEKVVEQQKEIKEPEVAVEEKLINGDSHLDVEETNIEKDDTSEPLEEAENDETEDIDGKNCYHFKEVNTTHYSEEEIYSPTLSEISTQAVAGSDTTRCEENFEYSRFLTVSKDQPIGESLRQLSARRSIKTMKNYLPLDGNTYNLNQNDVRKRKNCEDEFQDMKRAKKDSPGLMSYFGYPFKRNDVASSTPTLTGYRVNSFDNNMSKISLNSNNEESANKWCSVM